jgi:predicted TIM-barrel fold metal-dependent hydrolase
LIIDAHIHVGSWLHPDFLGRSCDLAGTLEMLRGAGVGGAALMPSDRCDNAGLLDDMRRAVEGGARERLWFFPWLRPASDGSDAAAELRWLRQVRKDVAGVKLHPSLSRVRVSDDAFRPILELAEELRLVILVHCGRWQEIAGWAHAVEAAERHRGTRWIFAHAGGDTPPNASNAARAVAERALDHVSFEFSGLREYWVIERNIGLLGADRYLLGSDFPLAHPNMYLGSVLAMALSDQDRRKVLGDNALRILGPALGEAR